MKILISKVKTYIPIFSIVIYFITLVTVILYFIILNNATFADFFNYNLPFCSLDTLDWCLLLFNHPQFADKCDKWDEFSDDEWEDLLEDHPDFVKYKK